MNGFSITARAAITANGIRPIRFLKAPECRWLAPFGSLNPTDGGVSQRYSLQGEWHGTAGGSETKIMTYGFYYSLDLFSDFTYYLTDPNLGDQFEQQDKRWVYGLDARHIPVRRMVCAAAWKTLFGLQVRNDWINNGLYQTDPIACAWTNWIGQAAPFCPPSRKRHDFTADTQAGIWAVEIQGSVAGKVPHRRGPCAATLIYFDAGLLEQPANSGHF